MPTLNFQIEEQQHNNWCWAAVAVSVSHYFSAKSEWCQCRLVSRIAKRRNLKVAGCGTCQKTKGVPEKCNFPWYLDEALRIVRRVRGKLTGPLSFSAIKKRIKEQLPIPVRITWGAGGAHFVVLSGCETSSAGNKWVDVEDPFVGSSTWLYEEFKSNYQYSQGRWTATFPV